MATLSERIAKRVRTKSKYAPHNNLAAVLALRKDIQQALNDGWSVRAIHQTLHDEGRVTFSYQAFRRHVNRIHLVKPLAEEGKQNQSKSNEELQQCAANTP
jgi:hypothetical protein